MSATWSLRAAMKAIEAQHPHWHVFLSDEGRIWAATAHNEIGGSGTTVDSGSCEGISRAIAEAEHQWAPRAAA